MRRYRLARPAKADLDQIWLHVARNASIETADRFIDTITGRFPFLAGSSEAGPARDEIEPGLRVFPVENYLIYYRKTARGGIQISRIIHGMRDQEKAWDREDDA
jgi:toxin ParE1/3/4